MLFQAINFTDYRLIRRTLDRFLLPVIKEEMLVLEAIGENT